MSEEKRLDTAANEQPKKKTKEQLYIDEAAKAGAREVLHLRTRFSPSTTTAPPRTR